MRKPAVLGFVVVAVAALALVAILGATERRTLAFTLGVPSFGAVAELRAGDEVCQAPIPVGAAFDGVELHLGTYARPGPELAVTVRREPGGALLAEGTLPAGYRDNSRLEVTVGDVPDHGAVAVCVANEGRRRVALYGGPDVTARTSTATIGDQPTGSDLDLVFRTGERSTLAIVPDMLERAALFRGGWIGPWLYWVLLGAVLIAVPVLIARALASASDAADGR